MAAEEIGPFDSRWSITLIDKQLNIEHDLRADATYVFQSQKGEPDNRFLLKFKIRETDSGVITAIDNRQSIDAMIYTNGENILIQMEGKDNQVFITDMLGHEVLSAVIPLNKGVWSFCPGRAGYYIVSLLRNDKRYYQKVYISSF